MLAAARRSKRRADDLFVGSPPLAFTFGLGGLLLFPLRVGAATLLLEKVVARRAAVRRSPSIGQRVLFTAPTSYRAMASQVARFDLSSLRKCVSAGEALPAATRKLWKDATGIEIIDGIGATELLHIFISHGDDDARPGATGKPVPGYVACVMDDDGQAAAGGQGRPAGRQGADRLPLSGRSAPVDLRQGRLELHRRRVPGRRRRLVHYQARTDDMIVSAGYNIAGPEVESALLLHPAVAECACVGAPDEERGTIVKAFVVLKPGHEGDDALVKALQAFVKQEIAPYKYPRAVEFVDTLPRTETGKLQRFRLRQLELQRAGASNPGASA